MTVGNWISIGAAVISASAAGIAWYMARRTRSLSTYFQTNSSLVQLNQIFIDYPDLRSYFIEGGKLPKNQAQKAKAIGSLILNTLEAVASQEIAMGRNELDAWKGYIKHQIRSVKIINELYESQKQWYPHLTNIIE